MGDQLTEGGLILPDSMPNFRADREKEQWFQGKATRQELMTEIARLDSRISEKANREGIQIANTMSKIYSMSRMNGLQLDALIELIDESVGNDFSRRHNEKVLKNIELVGFLDTLIVPGQPPKPMSQIIEEVRTYNARENVRQAEGSHFGLEKYIMEHPTEYTQEEVDKLNEEFKMEVRLPTSIPVVEEKVVLQPEIVT